MARTLRLRALAVLGSSALAAMLVAGCAGTPDPGPTPGAEATDTPTEAAPSPSPSASDGLAAFPIGQSVSTTALPGELPKGCRSVLDDAVLAQLEGVPLNAEGSGGGIRADSARVCVWGDPEAAATRLTTIMGYSPEREARDALYELGTQEGFTCWEPDDGIRCEKTWEHPSLPVEQGRTLFYRDGVIIDTQYSNLAPAGYTDAIIRSLWD